MISSFFPKMYDFPSSLAWTRDKIRLRSRGCVMGTTGEGFWGDGEERKGLRCEIPTAQTRGTVDDNVLLGHRKQKTHSGMYYSRTLTKERVPVISLIILNLPCHRTS